MSSHILPEVQAVCDRIIVVNRGAIVADGTPDSLAHDLSRENRLLVRMEGAESDLHTALQAIPGVEHVTNLGEKEPGVYEFSVEGAEHTDLRRPVFDTAAQHHWPILGMKSSDLTLEEVFLRLIGGETSEEAEPEEKEAAV